MELEKIISDTQQLSQRFHAVVGRLADDIMTIEGKLAQPVEQVRFAQ